MHRSSLEQLMSWWSKPSLVGRQVTLSDEGEGWFGEYADIVGIIEAVTQSGGGGSPYYTVRFEPSLELQESGADTRSGYILKSYSHCVIRCRWEGYDISADAPVSVHVVLVPTGTPLPLSLTDIVTMKVRVWASCVVTAENGRLR
jgi:hypothetical protein